MKKSKFIRSSIILSIGGMLTKILGMIIKIVLTRKIGTYSVGLYSIIMPTFLLILSISGMGITTSLNVLIPRENYNDNELLGNAITISIIVNVILTIIIFLFAPFISETLLHNKILTLSILSIPFVLPFISLSNILRSYYFSRERMIPHVISNILEDLIKLLLIIFFIQYFTNIKYTLSFLILTNIITESSSIIIFLICMKSRNIKPRLNIKIIKEILSISIPTTLSRLIGSFSYFLEPIILTTILIKFNYPKEYITYEYGIISGYVMPLLLLPSFFSNAIASALQPIISKYYNKKDIQYVTKKIIEGIVISFILGLSYLVICNIFKEKLLYLLYKTNEGINYIKFILPIMILYYIESPLVSSLHAMKKQKILLNISIVNFLLRTIGLIICLNFVKSIYGLLISLIINIIFTVLVVSSTLYINLKTVYN